MSTCITPTIHIDSGHELQMLAFWCSLAAIAVAVAVAVAIAVAVAVAVAAHCWLRF